MIMADTVVAPVVADIEKSIASDVADAEKVIAPAQATAAGVSTVSPDADLAQAKGAVSKLHTFMQNLGGVEGIVKADLIAALNEAGKYLSKLV